MCNIVCASALHLCTTCTGFVIVDVWEHEAHQCELELVRQDPGNGLVLDQQKNPSVQWLQRPKLQSCSGLSLSIWKIFLGL